MSKQKILIEESSGNIFADIGVKDASAHMLKAQIVTELLRFVSARKLSQAKAGEVMGISQPEVSRMFKGHFREYSIERLMQFLVAFGRDVDIVVRPVSGRKRAGKIRFMRDAA